MANIPRVNHSGLLYNRLLRRNQRPSETDDTHRDRQVDTSLRERRHLGDRRRKKMRVLLDRRNQTDRRHKKMVKSDSGQSEDVSKGLNINTTA